MSAIVWFRNDLRIHDNEVVFNAIKNHKEVYFLYIFDDRQFNKTTYGFPKTGKFRTKFLIESVLDLKKSLKKLGTDLIIKKGLTEKIIKEICGKYNINEIYYQGGSTQEETNIEENITNNLKDKKIKTTTFYSNTLYHIDDIPFSIDGLPEVFTSFRQRTEKISHIRNMFDTPKKINKPNQEIDSSYIPQLKDFTDELIEYDSRSVLDFVGGESIALERLKYYLWNTDLIKIYKETRNGLIGGNYSSKLSAWLANGCISPRKIYYEIKKYEKNRFKNDSTYWLIFELIWRDFFWFTALKYGNKIFLIDGTSQKKEVKEWKTNKKIFELWTSAKTGIPFIDANMREINQTGFMSNRGRQNVASFLTKDLKINWIWGAEYFESLLIDYDVTSNWCNWNYVAGVGSDPRENRYFNIIKQAKNYDRLGEYVKHWLPELNNLPSNLVHQPSDLVKSEQEIHKFRLGVDYPNPIVKLSYKE